MSALNSAQISQFFDADLHIRCERSDVPFDVFHVAPFSVNSMFTVNNGSKHFVYCQHSFFTFLTFRFIMKVGNGAFTMKDFDVLLGSVLREYRENRKMTQSEVAKLLHVTKMTISHWETGKRSMKAEDLKRYCKVLDVDVQEVLERT